MPSLSSCLTSVALIVTLTFSSTALAWESDVHYGLTKWLALQAGFADNWAEEVAKHNEGLDRGALSAVDSVLHYACALKDAGVSRNVRDNHFPSRADIPSKPAKRKVEAGSKAAWSRAHDRIKNPGEDLRYDVESFGKALHALQDSWSHQGEPSIPHWRIPLTRWGLTICDEELAWGHPFARGGWNSHDADLTWLHGKDVLPMGTQTLEALKLFLEKHPAALSPNPPPLKELIKDLMLFSQAQTKTDKKTWFVGQGFKDFAFLKGISLDNGKKLFDAPLSIPFRKGAIKQPPTVPPEAFTFTREFLRDWMMETTDFKAIVERYVDAVQVAEALRIDTGSNREVAVDAIASILRLWRVADHGEAARFLHRSVQSDKDEQWSTSGLIKTPGKLDLVSYKNVFDALLPISDNPEQPFVILPLTAKSSLYAVIARPTHTPYDTVAVIVGHVDGRWRVVSLSWVIEH